MTIYGDCPSLEHYCASVHDMYVHCFGRCMMREHFFVSVCCSDMHRVVTKVPNNRGYLKKAGMILQHEKHTTRKAPGQKGEFQAAIIMP